MDPIESLYHHLPLHLADDHGLFGSTYKPVELPFEPHKALTLCALE